MYRLKYERLWPLVLLVGFGAAAAQHEAREQVAKPQVEYESALRDYRPFSEQSVESWIETNDNVRKIGGWRAYAKERAAEPPAAQSSAAPQRSEPGKIEEVRAPRSNSANPHTHHGSGK